MAKVRAGEGTGGGLDGSGLQYYHGRASGL
jgi:hypothetical protein